MHFVHTFNVQPKRVAKNVKYKIILTYSLLMYVVFLDSNKILLYYYNTTVWRPLKK